MGEIEQPALAGGSADGGSLLPETSIPSCPAVCAHAPGQVRATGVPAGHMAMEAVSWNWKSSRNDPPPSVERATAARSGSKLHAQAKSAPSFSARQLA